MPSSLAIYCDLVEHQSLVRLNEMKNQVLLGQEDLDLFIEKVRDFNLMSSKDQQIDEVELKKQILASS